MAESWHRIDLVGLGLWDHKVNRLVIMFGEGDRLWLRLEGITPGQCGRLRNHTILARGEAGHGKVAALISARTL